MFKKYISLTAALAVLALLFFLNSGKDSIDSSSQLAELTDWQAPLEIAQDEVIDVPNIADNDERVAPEPIVLRRLNKNSHLTAEIKRAQKNAVFQSVLTRYRLGSVYPIAAEAVAFVENAEKNDEVTIDLNGVVLDVSIDAVQDLGSLRTVGFELNDGIGTGSFSLREDGRLKGNIYFYGESQLLLVKGDDATSYTVEQNLLENIICTPQGSTFPRKGESGFFVNSPGARQQLASAEGVTPAAFSSKPNSDFVIYLDFDGEVVDDPDWTRFNNNQTIIALPHPQANNDSWVEVVWKRVAEDFVPFDINVTTNRFIFDSTPLDNRVMCVVTPTDSAAMGAGGVAFLRSFGDGDVCWTFNPSEYACADTCSHEVGHTLGLIHDGQSGDNDEYFDGHGDGETSWGSIMGAPFAGDSNENVTQWSIGEYEEAVHPGEDALGNPIENTQDDLAVITSNGFGYEPDDHGDILATASGINRVGDLFMDQGLIEQSTDVDVFLFSTTGGSVSVNVDPLDVDSQEEEGGSDTDGANLAVTISLFDEGGLLIETSDSPDTLGVSLNLVLEAGVYYLSVEGDGRGDPETDGFSDYASLGQYFISGDAPTGPLSVFGSPSLNSPIVNGDPSPSLADGTYFGTIALSALETEERVFRLTNRLEEDLVVTNIEFFNENFALAEEVNFPIFLTSLESFDVAINLDSTSIGIQDDQVSITYYESSNPSEVFDFIFALRAVLTRTSEDDNYEENDSYFDAITLPDQLLLSEFLGSGKQSDLDWYAIDVLPGFNELNIQLDYIHAQGNIDMSLFDPNGFALVASETAEDGETINYEVGEEGGRYYVVVYGDDVQNEYDLIWEGLSPLIFVAPDEDEYEENNHFNSPYDLGEVSGQSLSDLSGFGVQHDLDWYSATLSDDEAEISVDLSRVSGTGSLSVTLFSGNGFQLDAATLEPGGNLVSIEFIGEPSANYKIVVSGSNEGVVYDLTVEGVSVSVSSESEDVYESNNTFFDPYDLSESSESLLSNIDGNGAQFDVDWYKIKSLDGENRIRFELFPDSIANTLIFAFYDSRGFLVREIVSPLDGESLTVETDLGVDAFYVLVYGADNGEQYDFSWESIFLSPEDDIYEDNDTLETAVSLRMSENMPLSTVDGLGVQQDADWYSVLAGAGDSIITGNLLPVGTDDRLTLTLYDEEGNQVDTVESLGLDVSITYEGPVVPDGETATYYFEISGDDLGAQYDFSWNARIPGDDDEYEENDFLDEAFVLPFDGMSLSNLDGEGRLFDLDIYQMTFDRLGGIFSVSLESDESEIELDLFLFDESGALLGVSLNAPNNANITVGITTELSRTVFIYVVPFGFPNGAVYDMEWEYDIAGGDLNQNQIDDEWESANLGSRNYLIPDSNDDGDQYPVWAEYAIHGDPDEQDVAPLNTYVENGFMNVSFNRNKRAYRDGYRYKVKESSTLDFVNFEEPIFVEEIDRGDYQEVIYRSATSFADGPVSFFTLEIKKPQN